MTNFEKYKDEILEIVNTSDCKFAIDKRTGKLCKCSDMNCCGNCRFYRTGGNCNAQMLKWLYEEYKEPKVKISAFGLEFLKELKKKGYYYLTRDNDNRLYVSSSSVKKEGNCWHSSDPETRYFLIDPVIDVFDFVKWTDKEPWIVWKILDNCIHS